MRTIVLFIFATAVFGQSPSSFETHLTAGETALRESRYSDADSQLHAAVADLAQPDPNRPAAREVEAYSALCDLDLLLSRFDEAISLAGKAVDIAAAGSATDPAASLSPQLARLAGAYRAAAKTVLAIPVLERMLTIDLASAPTDPKAPNAPNISVDYDKLGSAYMELGLMDDARTAYQHALDTRIATLGPGHNDVAVSWVNLGVLEDRDMKPKAAQTDFETALAISEKNSGTESYAITGILDRLGKLFSDQKQYAAAEPEFQRSLAIREKVLGAHHTDVAPALENLATAYFFDGKYIEAEPLFQRALQVWTATQGEASPLVAQALDNLGALYSAQKKYAEAEPFFRKALAIRESKDIESLSNLALVYAATSDLKRADDYFQRAILIGEKGLGSDHPEVLTTLGEYATTLRAVGRIEDAKKVEAQLKELKDRLTPEVTAGVAGVAGATGAMPATGRGKP